MSPKSRPITELRENEALDSEEEMVLRDESDEIIDDLKRKLGALQGRLAHQQSGGAGGAAAENPALEMGAVLAARLQPPTEELTGRLENIIEKVADPALKEELERCRDTAFFLFDTFRRISDHHKILAESLHSEPQSIVTAAFCQQLEDALRARGREMHVVLGQDLPGELRLVTGAAVAVVTTLTEIAFDIFGSATHIHVSWPKAADSSEGKVLRLAFNIISDSKWEGLDEATEVAAIAFRSGIRTHSVVDLLYVEKMITMQGGALSFHRREKEVYGFEVALPVDQE